MLKLIYKLTKTSRGQVAPLSPLTETASERCLEPAIRMDEKEVTSTPVTRHDSHERGSQPCSIIRKFNLIVSVAQNSQVLAVLN